MALDMMLEVEGDSLNWKAMAQAAERLNVSNLKCEESERFSGNFMRSHVIFWLGGWDPVCHPILAEGYHGCDFQTRCTIVFRINNSLYDESVQDIKDFLTHLSELSTMQFVLSFQYEEIHAVRCKHGFEYFGDKPRGPDWRPPEQPPHQTERGHPTLLAANHLRRFLNKLHLVKKS